MTEDDRAIAGHHLQKWWGDQPGIRIVLGPFVPFEVTTVRDAVLAVVPTRAPCVPRALDLFTGAP